MMEARTELENSARALEREWNKLGLFPQILLSLQAEIRELEKLSGETTKPPPVQPSGDSLLSVLERAAGSTSSTPTTSSQE